MTSFNNTTMEMQRKTELFDILIESALKPLTENSREYFQIMDTMEMFMTVINVIEEIKSVINLYGFGVNYNYYLCEKSDFYTDHIIKEKVCPINTFYEIVGDNHIMHLEVVS